MPDVSEYKSPWAQAYRKALLSKNLKNIMENRKLKAREKLRLYLDAARDFISSVDPHVSLKAARRLDSIIYYLEKRRPSYSVDILAGRVMTVEKGGILVLAKKNAIVVEEKANKINRLHGKLSHNLKIASNYAHTIALGHGNLDGEKKSEYVGSFFDALCASADYSSRMRASYAAMANAARKSVRAQGDFRKGAAISGGITAELLHMGLGYTVGFMGASKAAPPPSSTASDEGDATLVEERLLSFGAKRQ